MDAVDNNDFLFMYLVVGKQYFDFTWMFVDNNDFLDAFMYLVVGNNIWILHGCCG